MKNVFIKVVSSLISSIFLSSSLLIQLPNTTEKAEIANLNNLCKVNENCTISQQNLSCYKNSQTLKPLGKQKIFNEQVLHVKTSEEGKNSLVKPHNYKPQAFNYKPYSSQSYTMSDLNAMTYDEMIKLVSSIKWNDITDLFNYNYAAKAFYSDSNRVQALINAIESKGKNFTKDDNKGIPTLIEVLRSGFYLAFYNDGLKQINNRDYHNKCIPAILSIQKNPNFKLGTEIQDDLISSVGLLINNASCNVEVVNNFVPILNQYKNNFSSFIQQLNKGTAIYNIIDGVQYDINDYIYTTGKDYSDTIWSNKIDNFLNILSNWALMGNLNSDNEWLINNSIFYLAKIGKIHTNNKEGQRVLTEAMKIYEYLGEQYLQAAFSLSDYYNNKDYYGKTIDINKIKNDTTKKYLPKQYKFDNGKIIINTGNNVTEEKIKRVYWASKEVQAQFFRNLGSDKSLDQGNADDILTIVLYNSPKEYQMNRLLNGLDVNNGGMYIENTGTFYTYERTADESIYTLEELFRHEFTHYLQGRYLVPGLWGSGDIYSNNRLTWFEEGGAEFFAGSTRTSGILARKSVVSNIKAVDESSWYTANQTMHSAYGSFEFYHYGFALQNYLYNKDFVKLYDLMQAIKNNNVSKYDSLISNYSKDSNLENNYKNQIRTLVNDYDNLTTPLVSDDYLKEISKKNSLEIYNDITKVASLTGVTTEKINSQFFNSFKLEGKFNAGKSQGTIKDLKNMDDIINNFINTLSSYQWNGYKTVTAYMVDYSVDNNNNVIWTLVFNGILNDDGETPPTNIKPVANINGPYSGKINDNIKFTSKDSRDEDGTISEYLWNFGDNTTSADANPSHKYTLPGNYKVTLKVTDDKGDFDIKETVVTIEKVAIPSDDNEIEPNDTFDKATPYKKANILMNGSLSERDKDIYYFDVVSDGTIDITVMNNDNKGINWLVYNSSDKENYIAYPTTDGNELKGSFQAKKGRYYLVVYEFDKNQASYTLQINGNISSKIDEPSENEKENNDTFKLANLIKCDTIVNGSLDDKDTTDKYYFEISSQNDVEITVEKATKYLGISWMLYKEKDLKNYIAYPTTQTETTLSTKIKLAPGKYYINIYRYSGKGNYSLAVNNIN